jgi:hypothetical protein
MFLGLAEQMIFFLQGYIKKYRFTAIDKDSLPSEFPKQETSVLYSNKISKNK